MLGRKPKQSIDTNNDMVQVKHAPLYNRPKILLIDLSSNTADALKSKGYNVSSGTFGARYRIEKDNFRVRHVTSNALLPNFTEQEILVIDLTEPSDVQPPKQDLLIEFKKDVFVYAATGYINPRPRAMWSVADSFDRILSAGGIFIIFAQPRSIESYLLGSIDHGNFRNDSTINLDNWGFLTILNEHSLNIDADDGQEIIAVNHDWELVKVLAEHCSEGHFDLPHERWARPSDYCRPASNCSGLR